MKTLYYKNKILNSAYQIFKGSSSIWGMDENEDIVWEYNSINENEMSNYTLGVDKFDSKAEDLTESVEEINNILSNRAYYKKYAPLSKTIKKDVLKIKNELYDSNSKKYILKTTTDNSSANGLTSDVSLGKPNTTGRNMSFLYRSNQYIVSTNNTGGLSFFNISLTENNRLKTKLKLNVGSDIIDDYVCYNINNILYIISANRVSNKHIIMYVINLNTFITDSEITIDAEKIKNDATFSKDLNIKILNESNLLADSGDIQLDLAYNNNKMIVTITDGNPNTLYYYEMDLFSTKKVSLPLIITRKIVDFTSGAVVKNLLVEPYKDSFVFYYMEEDTTNYIIKRFYENSIPTIITSKPKANTDFIKLITESSDKRNWDSVDSIHFLGITTADTSNSNKIVFSIATLKNNLLLNEESIDCETIGTTSTYLIGPKSINLIMSSDAEIAYISIPQVSTVLIKAYNGITGMLEDISNQVGMETGYLTSYSVTNQDEFTTRSYSDTVSFISLTPCNVISSGAINEERVMSIILYSEAITISNNISFYFYHSNISKLANNRDYIALTDDSYICSTFDFNNDTLGIAKHNIAYSDYLTNIYSCGHIEKLRALGKKSKEAKAIFSDKNYVYILENNNELYRALKESLIFSLYHTFSLTTLLQSVLSTDDSFIYIDSNDSSIKVLNKSDKLIKKSIVISEVASGVDSLLCLDNSNNVYCICKNTSNISFIKKINLDNDLVSTLSATQGTNTEEISVIYKIVNDIIYYCSDSKMVQSNISSTTFNKEDLGMTIANHSATNKRTFSSYDDIIHFRDEALTTDNISFGTYDLSLNIKDNFISLDESGNDYNNDFWLENYPNVSSDFIYMIYYDMHVPMIAKIKKQVLIEQSNKDSSILDDSDKIKLYMKPRKALGIYKDIYVSYVNKEESNITKEWSEW